MGTDRSTIVRVERHRVAGEDGWLEESVGLDAAGREVAVLTDEDVQEIEGGKAAPKTYKIKERKVVNIAHYDPSNPMKNVKTNGQPKTGGKESKPKTEKGPGWGRAYRMESVSKIVHDDFPPGPYSRYLAVRLAMEISSHLNGRRTDGLSYVTRKSLCEATGASPDAVRQSLRALELMGFIRREGRKILVIIPEGEAQNIRQQNARKKKKEGGTH